MPIRHEAPADDHDDIAPRCVGGDFGIVISSATAMRAARRMMKASMIGRVDLCARGGGRSPPSDMRRPGSNRRQTRRSAAGRPIRLDYSRSLSLSLSFSSPLMLGKTAGRRHQHVSALDGIGRMTV